MNVFINFFIKVFNVCIRSPMTISSENLMAFVSDVLKNYGLDESIFKLMK